MAYYDVLKTFTVSKVVRVKADSREQALKQAEYKQRPMCSSSDLKPTPSEGWVVSKVDGTFLCDVRVPDTARRLELFSDKPGAEDAAKEIAAALMSAAQAFTDRQGNKDAPNDVAKCLGWAKKKFVDPVTDKHSSLGAGDTEPRYHIDQFLIDIAKMEIDGNTDSYRSEWGNWL